MADGQRFPYTPIQNVRGELLLRPALTITLARENQFVTVSGLLDTGADVNVLPYHLGIKLGAVWDEHRLLAGLSGNLANYETRDIVLSSTIGEFKSVQLAFAWVRTETVPLILGQVNFFMEFDVCFFRSRSLFEISLKPG